MARAFLMALVGSWPALQLAHPGPCAAQSPESPVATTDRFELRSDPRVALHHLLIDWAAAEAGTWPPFATPIAEREGWRARLDGVEREAWAAAVDAYAATRGRSLLFDPGLLALRDWAAGAAEPEAIPEADRALAAALQAALPVYLRRWWPEHERRNREWIASVAPRLAELEEAVVPRLVAAYGGAWPDGPVPIDVVPYANPVGAYSTGGRITISSLDPENAMPQGLELVFHEASHVDPLERPLRAGVEAAYAAAGGTPPDRLWHDLVFYTSGEITRIVLAERGEPGYQHYGEATGVYERGDRWAAELEAFERHWGPFLHAGAAGEEARRAALEGVARELLGDRDG